MWRLWKMYSLRQLDEFPSILPVDSRESFLARVRIRKFLQYTRLGGIILLIAGPLAWFTYPSPGGEPLALVLSLTGVAIMALLPALANWKHLQAHSQWVSLILTVIFLVPSVAAVTLQPSQEGGRGFVIVGLATGTYCLSRSTFFGNYVLIAICWVSSWHFSSLEFGTDEAIYCFLAVPAVGFSICSLQRELLISLFDLQSLSVDQQNQLQRTLEQLTEESLRRREEERLKFESHDQLQEQQEQLLHVSRLSALGEMAAGIAHEVRQPLHALSMYAGVLDSLVATPEPDRQRLKACSGKVGEIVRHTSEVIRRLQNFASRGAGEVTAVSLEDVIHDAVLLTEPEWKRRGVQIEMVREYPVSKVLADGVQLRQVAVNLLRNSCEAMDSTPVEDRRINVSLRDQDGYVEISIADTGCGFTVCQKVRVFETFYTTKPNGLGMGMSISRRIIEEHRGTLELISAECHGATFLIRLPILDPTLNTNQTDTIHGGSSSLPD